jgi:uncharacterized protein (TIGR00369 family)
MGGFVAKKFDPDARGEKLELMPLAHGAQHSCFGCGPANRTGLKLKFYVNQEHTIVCHFRIPRRFEGPPGLTHGGVIATLLDEAMSKVNRHKGVVAMTRQMDVEYLRPVPLNTPLRLEGRSAGGGGRVHRCEAAIVDGNGAVLAQSKGVFIQVDPAKVLAKYQPEED